MSWFAPRSHPRHSAHLARKEIVDAMPIFRHVHTFSGHGGGVAAAIANIAICERHGFVSRARENGRYFLERLKDVLADSPIVGSWGLRTCAKNS